MQTALSLSEGVRWCAIEGAVFVLDIEQGEYFVLGVERSGQWQDAMAGSKPDDALLADLRSRGWLAGSQSPDLPRGSAGNWFSRAPRLGAACALITTRIRLRLKGFAAAYRYAQSLGGAEAGPPARHLQADLDAFLAAEGWLPSKLGNDDCLPRSLALFQFLRARGHAVTHQIGIGRFPFDAHAWVESHGVPLLEFQPEQKLLPGARTPRGRTPIATLA